MTNATNVYAVTMMIVDANHQFRLPEQLWSELENADGPGDCAQVVVSVKSHPVEWHDDHPLNKRDTWRDAFTKLFMSPEPLQVTAAERERDELRAEVAFATSDRGHLHGVVKRLEVETERLRAVVLEAVTLLEEMTKHTPTRDHAFHAAKLRAQVEVKS